MAREGAHVKDLSIGQVWMTLDDTGYIDTYVRITSIKSVFIVRARQVSRAGRDSLGAWVAHGPVMALPASELLELMP